MVEFMCFCMLHIRACQFAGSLIGICFPPTNNERIMRSEKIILEQGEVFPSLRNCIGIHRENFI